MLFCHSFAWVSKIWLLIIKLAECLGIGIDDMFVISQCWSNMKKDPSNTKLSLPDQMGVALKHAGVSITITTVTDVFAFGVGAFSVSFFFVMIY